MLDISTESHPPILKELTILNILPSFNFLVELELLNKAPSSYTQPKGRKVRKRRSAEKRNHENSLWNETQKWIFDSEHDRFEKLKSFCIKTASKDSKTGDIIYENYEDFFMAWVTDLCNRNTLAEKINNKEKVNKSALYWWYRQFIQRASMKSAQDAHSRVFGAKTQSEITHEKNHMHDIQHLEKSGFKEALVIHKYDEETGNTGEPDYYVEDNPFEFLHKQSVQKFVWKLLERSYGCPKKTRNRFQIYEEILEGRGGFPNLQEWADSHGISINKLKRRITHIENLLAKHKDNI